MKKQKRVVKKAVQGTITIVLFVLIFFMIYYVNNIQGTARVVNYAGLVRGATQQMVKMEIVGKYSQEKIDELNEYVSGIQDGSEKLNLIKIEEENYQAKVTSLSKKWEELKTEIELVRTKGYKNTNIVKLSEEYFDLSDQVVDLAEKYSQKCATLIRNFEGVIIALIIVLVLMMLEQSINALRIMRMNGELSIKVYKDHMTGLANRNKCMEILENPALIKESTCFYMFDLNNLKYVNDNMGHKEGDILIENFARLIRDGIDKKYFVGRYGGDEFIVITSGDSRPKASEIIDSIQTKINQFNKMDNVNPISYAVGFAESEDFEVCTMGILLSKADENMYKNKKITKKKFLDLVGEQDDPLQQKIRELEYEATHDGLTGLIKKTSAFRMIDVKLKNNQESALMVMDIDNFKVINDSLGHKKGDEILKEVGEILLMSFRKEDVVARFGGDEFLIYLSSYSDYKSLEEKAQYLISFMNKKLEEKYKDIDITVSIGISTRKEADTAEKMFTLADERLYKAKNNGKNQFVIK